MTYKPKPPGPTPARTCDVCGEWLPHYCAAIVITWRQPFTSKRMIEIIDREPAR